ncbi:MAG: DUF2474 family protein [Paracoccus sp. (in: a-proteobacteria)]
MATPPPMPPSTQGAQPRPLWLRLAWMVAIWTAGVLVLTGVSLLIRLWLAG